LVVAKADVSAATAVGTSRKVRRKNSRIGREITAGEVLNKGENAVGGMNLPKKPRK
jgi:hypothetical protein